MTKYELHDAPPAAGASDRHRRYFPEDMLEELRANPGQWAQTESANNSAQASYWRKRLEPEGFVIVTRRQEDGTHEYWASYQPQEG